MSADNPAGAPRPFDSKMVEYLVGLMAEHDLSEIDLHEGERRIRLRRGHAAPPVAGYAMMPTAPPPAHAGGSIPNPVPTRNLHEIKSPMVGTFYAKPAPDKPDYVSVGSRVKVDTVVCKLEAMKIFNDLTAECDGVIAEVCAKNGQPVDFGTVLYRVEPS